MVKPTAAFQLTPQRQVVPSWCLPLLRTLTWLNALDPVVSFHTFAYTREAAKCSELHLFHRGLALAFQAVPPPPRVRALCAPRPVRETRSASFADLGEDLSSLKAWVAPAVDLQARARRAGIDDEGIVRRPRRD